MRRFVIIETGTLVPEQVRVVLEERAKGNFCVLPLAPFPYPDRDGREVVDHAGMHGKRALKHYEDATDCTVIFRKEAVVIQTGEIIEADCALIMDRKGKVEPRVLNPTHVRRRQRPSQASKAESLQTLLTLLLNDPKK